MLTDGSTEHEASTDASGFEADDRDPASPDAGHDDASVPDGSVDELDGSVDELDGSVDELDGGRDGSSYTGDAADADIEDAGSDAQVDASDGGSNSGGGDAAPPDDTGPIYDEIKPEDCEQSIELRAFSPSSPNEGFPVGQNVNNTFECFDFEVPYDGKLQALLVEPIIDDERVVHSWRLYDTGGDVEGNLYWNCTGQHPAAQLLAGWAPGRGVTMMPRGVGLRLPQGGTGHFTLEIHYNNAARYAGVKDRSGARICATSELRQHEAAVHWLGTEAFFGTTAAGTCTVPKTATILHSWPHMHALGAHMKMVLTKKSGAKVTMLDKPFSVDDQRSYDTPMEVQPGDSILTTCTYDGLAAFGNESEKEHCYNYVLAYPVGALSNGLSLTGAQGTCLQ